jgi:hypothetical protein
MGALRALALASCPVPSAHAAGQGQVSRAADHAALDVEARSGRARSKPGDRNLGHPLRRSSRSRFEPTQVESINVSVGPDIDAPSSKPAMYRRWLVRVHIAAAAYSLPAFFLAGRPATPRSLASTYQMSAIALVGVLATGWNIAYWLNFFLPADLSPEPRRASSHGRSRAYPFSKSRMGSPRGLA